MPKRIDPGCACGQCSGNYGRASIRKCPLDANELARLKLLRNMSDKRLAALVPAWAKPAKPPAPFKFVPNAPPVYKNLLTPQTKPAHAIKYVSGGPFDGVGLDLCTEHDGITLEIIVAGQRGRYVKGKWEASQSNRRVA
jgi:hypothetical protein